MRGRASNGLLEGVELGHDFAADQRADPIGAFAARAISAGNDRRAVASRGCSVKSRCKPTSTRSRGRSASRAAPARHAGARHHATDGGDSAQVRQLQRGLVDARVQPEIVEADGDLLLRHVSHSSDAMGLRGAAPSVSETAHRVVRFIAVGCMAAAVHLGVVVLLVGGLGWAPLVANVVGWLVAFGFSLTGHRLLTFRSRRAAVVARRAPLLRGVGRRLLRQRDRIRGAAAIQRVAVRHRPGIRAGGRCRHNLSGEFALGIPGQSAALTPGARPATRQSSVLPSRATTAPRASSG